MTIDIRAYAPGDAGAFWSLNAAWITTTFAMEDSDRKVLSDPQGEILDPGGDILMAVEAGRPVGCVALLRRDSRTLEVAKMTVDESLRGSGLGKRLLQAAIDRARAMGAAELYLESNTRLIPAISLYRAMGFVELGPQDGPPSPYARCDIRMRMPLHAEGA